MADRLYLSLWYPNFRLENLPAALNGVLHQFAVIGAKRVSAASAYPINFTEPPTYQRIYVESDDSLRASPPEIEPTSEDSYARIESAVAEATEQLHDDMAYEFEMRWQLWAPEGGGAHLDEAEDAYADPDPDPDTAAPYTVLGDLDTTWSLRPHAVRVLGFGPAFDTAGFEQNGHILVDFGLDTPWVFETEDARPLDQVAQVRIQQNVEKLLAFTLLVEKNCGISSRLLWTESGEPLAAKLIGRLQKVN